MTATKALRPCSLGTIHELGQRPKRPDGVENSESVHCRISIGTAGVPTFLPPAKKETTGTASNLQLFRGTSRSTAAGESGSDGRMVPAVVIMADREGSCAKSWIFSMVEGGGGEVSKL